MLRGCTTSEEQCIFFLYFIDKNSDCCVIHSNEFSLGLNLKGLLLILSLLTDWVCEIMGYANVHKILTIVPGEKH